MSDIKNKTGNANLATGIAIGAAIGAAAVAMKDKKNQEKIKGTVRKIKKWADKTAGSIHEKRDEILTKSDRVIDDAKVDLEKASKEIKEPRI